MDFKSMGIDSIIGGKTPDGVSYLALFLQEYTRIFKGTVNAGCTKCLQAYLTKYKNHFLQMENTCKYRLKLKYEGIPLEFGSPVLVTNANITDEYAKILLSRNDGGRYFSSIPDEEITVNEPQIVKADAEPKPAQDRKKRTKKK